MLLVDDVDLSHCFVMGLATSFVWIIDDLMSMILRNALQFIMGLFLSYAYCIIFIIS